MEVLKILAIVVVGLIAVWSLLLTLVYFFTRSRYGHRMRKLPSVAHTVEPLRELRKQAGAFTGVEGVFGCRHRQHIQLLHRDEGHILRNVPYQDAPRRNCHTCWFRSGVDVRQEMEPQSDQKASS